ncbi:sigma-70 family RNA polymerase sigma factor [Aquamicrobium defluvii]
MCSGTARNPAGASLERAENHDDFSDPRSCFGSALNHWRCKHFVNALSKIQVAPTRSVTAGETFSDPVIVVTTTLADIFLSNRKSIMWSVLRIVRDPQTAEDVAQETYVRARRAIERGPIDHIEAFLFQTARNIAIDLCRRREMLGQVERDDVPEEDVLNVASPLPSQEASLIGSERLRLLDEAIRKLPERARTVWYLNRVEKWSYPRIAKHLGVSPNTVFNDFKLAHGHCVAAMARIDRS